MIFCFRSPEERATERSREANMRHGVQAGALHARRARPRETTLGRRRKVAYPGGKGKKYTCSYKGSLRGVVFSAG